jgi:hypothetical protein
MPLRQPLYDMLVIDRRQLPLEPAAKEEPSVAVGELAASGEGGVDIDGCYVGVVPGTETADSYGTVGHVMRVRTGMGAGREGAGVDFTRAFGAGHEACSLKRYLTNTKIGVECREWVAISRDSTLSRL